MVEIIARNGNEVTLQVTLKLTAIQSILKISHPALWFIYPTHTQATPRLAGVSRFWFMSG